MTFAEKIVRLRKIKGLTQDEFASAVGVSRQAVYKWEAGQSYPEVTKLVEMKLLFNISIDDLLDENYEVALPEKKKRKRLTKEAKREIEEKVLTESGLAATVIEETPIINEEPKEGEIPVAAAISVEEIATEEPVAVPEEIAPVAEETAPVIEEASAEEAAPEKKKGFFGRLFGKK